MYTKTTMAKKASSSADSAPAPVSVPASTPKVEKIDKAAKPPKSSKTDANASVSTPTPVVATPAPTSDAHTDGPAIETSLSSLFSEFGSKLHTLSSGLSSLRSDFRTLERNVAREMRAVQKASKRKRKTGNRAPSGFVKPTLISKELAEFLGKPIGTELARTEVTREINAYIRAHNLQDKENGRKINPDTKLKSLLQVKKGDELVTLQRLLLLSLSLPLLLLLKNVA
jgi:chromatin remodeling complex protein RSC6